MRWGSGQLRWVRPLHSILCVFDGEVVPFEIEGIRSGDETLGHRFMAPGPIRARCFAAYASSLRAHHVIVDAEERAERIRAELRNLALARGLEVVPDEALVRETAGLVEWPVVLLGEFAPKFLEVPAEVIVTAIRTHQKCFASAGCEVAQTLQHLCARRQPRRRGRRQADHRRQQSRDRRPPCRCEVLLGSGSQDDPRIKIACVSPSSRSTRDLAVSASGSSVLKHGRRSLRTACRADPVQARLAARLSKTDLTTGVVGEFPELQGLMGRYYAEAQGLDKQVAAAIEEHYRPKGPHDAVPAAPVSMAVGLAERLDTLVGFWAIDEKPTGSKDPYALRRAALGAIRIILENGLRIPLLQKFQWGLELYADQRPQAFSAGFDGRDLLSFFAERLKVHLRDRGSRHDLIDAVFALGR